MKSLLLFTFLFSLTSVASELTSFAICESQGEQYGRLNEISDDCKDYAANHAKVSQVISTDGIDIVGYKNILFIDYTLNGKVKHYKVAGDRSGITDIKAVSLGGSAEKVYLINEGKIFVYKTMTSGNSAPIQVIDLAEINCSKLTVTDDEKHYYAQCNNKLLHGSLTGDSRLTAISKKPMKAKSYLVDKSDRAPSSVNINGRRLKLSKLFGETEN